MSFHTRSHFPLFLSIGVFAFLRNTLTIIYSWLDGYQLYTGGSAGCNMRRIVSLHPDHFSKHFLYHVANDKQKQLPSQRFVRADHLWGQINSVRIAAIRAKSKVVVSSNDN